jgi:multiple sugar transport system permease protein
MYTLNLYIKGFVELSMGYASAMAWVFLLTIGLITTVLFSTGRFWVHYSDAGEH